jgi:hypothetical protein
MADWLEIANTFINLTTMERVGDVSRAQQQIADQMLANEAKKQKDNALLSQLVDVAVKVREFLQNGRYLDALFTAGVGILSFKKIYAVILDAETKLRASDIQMKLLETVRSSFTDDSARLSLKLPLSEYLGSIIPSFRRTISQLGERSHQLLWIDPGMDFWFNIGDQVVRIRDFGNNAFADKEFKKDEAYEIAQVVPPPPDPTQLIGLTGSSGQTYRFQLGHNGAAKTFAYFETPLPSMQKEIAAWQLCNQMFGEEFLSENLSPVRQPMLDLFSQALESAGVSREEILQAIGAYEDARRTVVSRCSASLLKEFPQLRGPLHETLDAQGKYFDPEKTLVAIVVIALIIGLILVIANLQ